MSQHEQQTTQTDTQINRSTANTDRPEKLEETPLLTEAETQTRLADLEPNGDVNGGYGGSHALYQDVTIPAGVK